MEKLKSLIILMFIALVVPTYALAEEIVNVADESTLTNCVSQENKTCKVTSEIVLNSVLEVSNETIIDLNGNTIKASESLTASSGVIIVHNGGKLTVNDETNTGIITSGTNGKVYGGIQLTKKLDVDTNVATLIINGGTISGYYYGIVGNGTRNNTSITINGGKVLGLNESDSLGIFNPQVGTVVINGGTVSGATGIEMRSGSLIVNNGTISGTMDTFSMTPNGSGSTTIGAGIALAQHSTKNALSATIKGGTISGNIALKEKNIQNNESEKYALVSLSITGGDFTSHEDSATIESEKTKFITGGTFNKLVEYVNDGYAARVIEGKTVVGKLNSVIINTITNGTVSTDKTSAIKGEIVNLTVKPNDDYLVATLLVTDSVTKQSITVTEDKFVMPENNVTITVIFAKIQRKITIESCTNGTVNSDKEYAITGENVKISITPNDDYLLDSLNVYLTGTTTKVDINNNEFVMPKSGVSIVASFKLIERDVKNDSIDLKKEVDTAEVGIINDDVTDILVDSLISDTNISENVKNSNISFSFDIDMLEEKDVDTKILEDLQNKLPKGTLATLFDVSINILNKDNNEKIGELTELTEEIEIIILLPDNLKNTNKDFNREYYIVREHNGVYDLLKAELSNDGKYLIVKTNKCSTFGLLYLDTEIENPKTLDGINNSILVIGLSVISIALCGAYIIKTKEN